MSADLRASALRQVFESWGQLHCHRESGSVPPEYGVRSPGKVFNDGEPVDTDTNTSASLLAHRDGHLLAAARVQQMDCLDARITNEINRRAGRRP